MRTDRLEALLISFSHRDPDSVNLETWTCGTQACLGGHACLMPEFQAEGLRLAPVRYGLEEPTLVPTFEGLRKIDALAAFFGLTDRQACDLFAARGWSDFDAGRDHFTDYSLASYRLFQTILQGKAEQRSAQTDR